MWTFEPDHFTGHHLRSYLPDLPAVDLARFPNAEVLTGELTEAGFGSVEVRWFQQTGSVSRARAAEQLRARHLSTIHLLPPEQVAAAAERLEREAAAAEPELATVLRLASLVVAPGRNSPKNRPSVSADAGAVPSAARKRFRSSRPAVMVASRTGAVTRVVGPEQDLPWPR